MNLYKLDFDGRKFFLHAFQAKSESDFSKEPRTKLVDSTNSHYISKEIAETTAEIKNNNLVHTLEVVVPTGSIMVKRCTKCKRYFIVDYYDWLSCRDAGKEVPNTCDDCRGYSLK